MKKKFDIQKLRDARFIYSVILGLMVFAVGLAIICVTADIYYSGKGTGVIYTREIVGERLEKLAIPLLILIAYAIAGVAFPFAETRVKTVNGKAFSNLRRRVPSESEEGYEAEYENARKRYVANTAWRIALWATALAVTVAGAIYSVVYLVKASEFAGADITAEVFEIAKHVLSWTVASLGVLAIASAVGAYLQKKQIKAMGEMIKYGDSESRCGSAPIQRIVAVGEGARSFASHKVTVWTVRAVIIAIGVTFIVLGVLNGGARDVLIKAINICQECIGLG